MQPKITITDDYFADRRKAVRRFLAEPIHPLALSHPCALRTAFHEAGHAVVAIESDLFLSGVDIEVADGRVGAAYIDYPTRNSRGESINVPRVKAMASLAGYAAERLMHTSDPLLAPWPDYPDFACARRSVRRLRGQRSFETTCLQLWVDTNRLISSRLYEVAAIARALLSQLRLRGMEATDVFAWMRYEGTEEEKLSILGSFPWERRSECGHVSGVPSLLRAAPRRPRSRAPATQSAVPGSTEATALGQSAGPGPSTVSR